MTDSPTDPPPDEGQGDTPAVGLPGGPAVSPDALEPGALAGPFWGAFKKARPPWSAQGWGILIVLIAVVWALHNALTQIWHLVWWGVIAAFLYFALAPAVDFLVAHRWKRGLATGAIMLGLIVAIIGFVVAMAPLIVGETESAIAEAPAMMAKLTELAGRLGIDLNSASSTGLAQNLLSNFRGMLPNVAGSALSVTSALVGAFFEFFVILLFTFFLLANQDRFRHFVMSLLKPSTQTIVGQTWDVAVYKTGGYLYSRILTSIMAGFVVGVALWALDCPYALALAIWYGLISQFLPMIGTYVAAALPLLILLIRDPADAVIFLIVLAVWIPFQDYVISPRVSAHTMSLAPALALIALLVGGSLFGALGAFLALPAAAVLQSIASAFVPRHEVVDTAATRQAKRE